ncbi:hypothetical protein [Methylosinus sp. Sm6]|uniref:hypothetical protein n=1 Tax=Methylosinus sp. Sm6 TaxID=2866948 RepID=UPI001C9914BE|nr:hypothetical protein [Methylosinus sp. Sm6]MBY6243195.1 hypothetical protein [Methylosinus sp. Sm6]
MCFMLGTASAVAESGGAAGPVFGYFDPATNGFTPAGGAAALLMKTHDAAPLAVTAAVVRRGTLVITVNVGFLASFPAGATATASVTVETVPAASADPSTATSILASAQIRRSGSTGVATLSIPYAFSTTATTDKVSLDTIVYSSNGDYASLRQTIPLPADGATTRVTLSQRL